MSNWLNDAVKSRTPKVETTEVNGRVKILKEFSKNKDKQVLGGRIESGALNLKDKFRVLKNDEIVAEGKVTNLQTAKSEVKNVSAPAEFGMEVTCGTDIKPGDYIESFVIEMK